MYTHSYPAGFVYIYSGLYYLTDQGENIKLAQWTFAALYLVNLAIVLSIYCRLAKVQHRSLHTCRAMKGM